MDKRITIWKINIESTDTVNTQMVGKMDFGN